MAKLSYKDAGVDLDVYADAMARLPRLTHRTYSPRVMKLDGGFAGLFRLDFPGGLFARNYREPVLVSGTDGVGTKLKVATACDRHDSVGIDLVGMCVNDVLCCGAEPLFFLDYVAMSHDDPPLLEKIVKGISDGCVQADCALLGGETAIMPDLYRRGEYDLAGFCVGVAEREQLIDGTRIAPDDVLIGIGSSGFHSNGYSLIRKVVFEHAGLDVSAPVEELGATVGEILLEPTTIYVSAVRKVLNHYRVKRPVHGIAHITGGGLFENLERIVPDGVSLRIDRDSWTAPPAFDWLRCLADLDLAEMFRVFNMGIGMVMIVSPHHAGPVADLIATTGLPHWTIGRAVEVPSGSRKVAWSDSADAG
ncbi:MAG TPA: phosphoribosylformylglycinamidine cyclo-ligase [Pirellulaceae bacterium]|nr:phosphoribosylformylglycinamidine cyclo-ligase [Pirellulaceae bacterium]